jgi:hypothetical protein
MQKCPDEIISCIGEFCNDSVIIFAAVLNKGGRETAAKLVLESRIVYTDDKDVHIKSTQWTCGQGCAIHLPAIPHCLIGYSSENGLHYGHYPEVLEMLLELGAQVNHTTFMAQILTSSAEFEKSEILRNGSSALHVIALHPRLDGEAGAELLQLILTSSSPIVVRDVSGMSALHYAARGSSVNIVEMLAQYMSLKELQWKDNSSRTALALARERGEEAVIEVLQRRESVLLQENSKGARKEIAIPEK